MTKDFIFDEKIEKILMSNDINGLLNILLPQNKKLTSAIFFETLRLIYIRQRSRDKILNNKEITFLLNLAHFHQCKKEEIIVDSNSQYRVLFGKEIDEEKAKLWFIDNLASVTVKDRFGREILIEDERIDCFYKDEISQRHLVSSVFFRLYRAKRLPWIRPTLENSREIYRLDKPVFKCEEFFYIGTFHIPLSENEDKVGETRSSFQTNYYVVLARKKYGRKQLEFITEYPIFDYLDLLKFIEKWQPFEVK